MSNQTSVWEQNFRQPSEDQQDYDQLRQQVAGTNALAISNNTARVNDNAARVADITASNARITTLEPQFITLTLLNGWVNFLGGFEPASAVKQGRLVQVQGLIRSGVVTVGTAFCILPPGWRPAENVMCHVHIQSGFSRVDVQPSGHIVYANEHMGNAAVYTSLNLSFFTA